MTHQPRTMLVTGGAGFIGSNYLQIALNADPVLRIVNLDALTYAGHPASQRRVADLHQDRYSLIEGDIREDHIGRLPRTLPNNTSARIDVGR